MAKRRKPGQAPVTEFPVKFPPRAETRREPVPEGRLEVVVTYLEMRSPPRRRRVPHRGERLAIMRAWEPTVAYYRFLYETVGAPWLWFERRLLDDDALRAIVHDPKVEVFVLYVAGVPAGFVELDRRVEEEVEIAYFGLMPDFIGRGLGQYFLEWAVMEAWQGGPGRVWVNTCTLDHPAAAVVYQRVGFEPYHQERKIIDDPRATGIIPVK